MTLKPALLKPRPAARFGGVIANVKNEEEILPTYL